MSADRPDDSPPDQNVAGERLGWRARLGHFLTSANSALSYIIGLPIITVLGGLIVGYYQYINAYQEKVRLRAENDVQMATVAFTEISKKFSEAQMLQRTMFSDFSIALDENIGDEERALATKHAKAIAPTYETAWVALLEAGDLMAHRTQIYIDWATDFVRNPADQHFPNDDPLSQLLLDAYGFECSENFPKFKFISTGASQGRRANTCQVDGEPNTDPDDIHVLNICPRSKANTEPPAAVTIQWYSARHQVLTMHYCFHVLHQRLAKVRTWALQDAASPAIKATSRSERDQIRKEIDGQTARLEAFMGLATFQIEAIREKYRPVSFACHIPFFTPLTSERNDACTPLRTAPYRFKKPENTPDTGK